MAEEAGDCISFQPDSLPTGSISFGRFSMETLAWERRSSFSHNRYLEEVEKYSTPGSVTEKKAYFEAHFRKKVPQPQSSTGRQNETENESKDSNPECYNGSDRSPGYVDDVPLEVINAPTVSYDQEMSIQKEASWPEHAASDPTIDEWGTFDRDGDGSHEIRFDNGTIPEDEDREKLALGEKPENVNLTLIEPLDKIDISINIPSTQGKTTSTSKSLTKVKETTERRTTKTRPKSQAHALQVPRKATDKMSSRNHPEKLGKLDKESTCSKSSEKQLLGRIPQGYVAKALRLESSGMPKASLVQENPSGKGSNPRKGFAAPDLTGEKCDTVSKISMIRSIPTFGSAKEEIKQTTRTFNFKSDERAEKRKEFNMKMEKKFNAKEAEMNEIQARTQEENVAEIKQLRKSLNFKAMPMPSFYRESMPRASDVKRPTATLGRSPKFQNKNHACRTLSNDKCQSSSIIANQVLPSGEKKSCQQVEDHLITSGSDSGSLIIVNEADRVDDHQQKSVSLKKIGVVKKDEKAKLTVQHQWQSGTGRKGERYDRQRNVGKVLKGIVSGSVPVHVAS